MLNIFSLVITSISNVVILFCSSSLNCICYMPSVAFTTYLLRSRFFFILSLEAFDDSEHTIDCFLYFRLKMNHCTRLFLLLTPSLIAIGLLGVAFGTNWWTIAIEKVRIPIIWMCFLFIVNFRIFLTRIR
jgi:hypothetical protein